MHILISNDDGVLSIGLSELHSKLSNFSKCSIVAPDRDQSGSSSALTLDRPLYLTKMSNGFISVNGTPADCVHLAIHGRIDPRPDIVVSGINIGANLGDDISYSGTFAAAWEGRFLESPSFAFSLASHSIDNISTAGYFAKKILSKLHILSLPTQIVFNVNIPDLPLDKIRGIKVTRPGERFISNAPEAVTNPRGKVGYWISGPGKPQDVSEDTDFYAIMQGYVSITPFNLDRSFSNELNSIKSWVSEINAVH